MVVFTQPAYWFAGLLSKSGSEAPWVLAFFDLQDDMANQAHNPMSAIIQPRVDLSRRVAAAREKAGISQAKLSQLLGFKNRQSSEQIESGLRRVASKELLTIMEATQCDVDYFTDPMYAPGTGSTLRDFVTTLFLHASPLERDVRLDRHAAVFLQRWKDSGSGRESLPNPSAGWRGLTDDELKAQAQTTSTGNTLS